MDNSGLKSSPLLILKWGFQHLAEARKFHLMTSYPSDACKKRQRESTHFFHVEVSTMMISLYNDNKGLPDIRYRCVHVSNCTGLSGER